jgi:hypothetical protein
MPRNLCNGIKKNGKGCRASALDNGYCRLHQSQANGANGNDEVKSEPDNKVRRMASRPWRPSSLINIPMRYRNPNFVYRAVIRSPERIQQMLEEGWEIDKELSKKMPILKATINDGLAIDGTVNFRELIVMRLPRELKESRDEYFRQKNLAQVSSKAIKSQFIHDKEGLQPTMPAVYGEVEVQQLGSKI